MGKSSYLNLNFLTKLFGCRKSKTNRSFLPSATVKGLQHNGRESTSTMQCFLNKSEMADCTNSGWSKLKRLFLAQNGGGGDSFEMNFCNHS